MNHLKLFLLSIGLVLFSIRNYAQSDYKVTDYGAIGDAKTLNTKVLQKLIDRVSQNGGGKIIFPSGVFLTGSIEIKDDVELHLEHQAILLGSKNPFHYKKNRITRHPF